MLAETLALCTALNTPIGCLEGAMMVTTAKALHEQFAISEASLLQGYHQHSKALHGVHGSSSRGRKALHFVVRR